MPPSDLQARVLALLSANRGPDSHLAGGVALNMDWQRMSYDIDIFHDQEGKVATAAEMDAALLRRQGFTVEWTRRSPAIYTARVSQEGQSTLVDWAHDSDVRFFPVVQDDRLGHVLHPFDLATNKALAAAARREPRDALDLVMIHERLYPLGVVAWAAVGKDEGYSPLSLLNMIGRLARYDAGDMDRILHPSTMSAQDLSRRLKKALGAAETLIASLPPETAGAVFLKDGRIATPPFLDLSAYEQRRPVRGGGIWPIGVGDSR